MRLLVHLEGRQVEVDAIPAPVGRGCFQLHRHPEHASLWCLTHRDSGRIVGTSWRYRTLADAAVRMWRALPRRERDVLRGVAIPRATGPKSSTYGTTIFVGQ